RRCAVVTAERDAGAQRLRRSGFSLPASQANFWWLPAGERATDLAGALERRGVVVRPFPTGVRVTVSTPDENARFFAAFEAVVGSDPGYSEAWQAPTGDAARAVADLLDALAAPCPDGA
ncbi:MAG TPA: hypothetical protein PLV68_02060, partial [Ilumatobacteraceae bacterium]|nr:hypothetical protein [Ilumatobacteraceae bacterium]